METGPSGHIEERSSLVDVPRGLFVLRYVEPAGLGTASVSFYPARGSEHLLQVLPQPGQSPAAFERPGEFIVISSLGGAQLHISVRGSRAPVQLEIHRIDRLLAGIANEPSRGVPVQDDQQLQVGSSGDFGRSGSQSTEDESDVGPSLVGHVARLGNIAVSPGAWLAGPNAPAPIEGLFLQLRPSAAQWIDVQVLVSGDRAWTDWRPATQYSGTQGRSLPLIGVKFRVSDYAPSDLELEASALFLGSSVVKQSGRHIEFRSAAGADPLVGIRFEMQRKPKLTQATSIMPSAGVPTRRRVRVFRAGVEQVSSRA